MILPKNYKCLKNSWKMKKSSGTVDQKFQTVYKRVVEGDGGENREYPKVEEELKEAFYELEDLIEKIKHNRDDDKLNMQQIDALLEKFRKENRIHH